MSVPDFLFPKRLRNQVRNQTTNHTAPVGYQAQSGFYFIRPPKLEV